MAVADFVLREYIAFQSANGSSFNPDILPLAPYVIESNLCHLDDTGELSLRLSLIHSSPSEEGLSSLITAFLHRLSDRSHELRAYWQNVEDQQSLRRQVLAHGGVAFIGDGSLLPRVGGSDHAPSPSALPFESPATLRRSFVLPFSGEVTGMLVPRGVTVITGGGTPNHDRQMMSHANDRFPREVHSPASHRSRLLRQGSRGRQEPLCQRENYGFDSSGGWSLCPQH